MSKKKVLVFDLETYGAEFIWDMPSRSFVRLMQYAWGSDGEVHLTTDYDEAMDLLLQADRWIGHNIISYDLPAMFGKESTVPLEAAQAGKVFDTMVHASLVYPPPSVFTTREGHTHYDGSSPGKAKKWLALDNLCFQLGLSGKVADLKKLAAQYRVDRDDPEQMEELLNIYDAWSEDELPPWAFDPYGRIPLGDPDFLEYAEQDVVAEQELTVELTKQTPLTDYHWREQLVVSINAQITRNGFTVDTAAAQERVEELAIRRQEIMDEIGQKYELPTEGKSPWATNAGKEVIFAVLAEHGITPENTPSWPKTDTNNPSLGGEALIQITEGTGAAEFAQALAELKGQRSLAQLALDSTHSDGKAHPDITTFQRSGRTSVTKPGLTVWTDKGDNRVEKRYFVASPGRKIVEFDYSQADARVVAAYSGDWEFAKRFEPGADAHDISGRVFFGDKYDREEHRQIAKAANHALGYRVGKKKLATVIGTTEEVAGKFIRAYQNEYPHVYSWQEDATRRGESGWITNDWGRKMRVDKDRSFTQSSALLGQSGTREIMYDGMIRMLNQAPRLLTWIVAPVHDALVFDIPEDELEWTLLTIQECMEQMFKPKDARGQEIFFSVDHGHPADNWEEAGH